MYCKTCGSRLEDGTRFCSSCGTPVENGYQTASRTPAVTVQTYDAAEKKKTIVTMAVIALCLLVVSKISRIISTYSLLTSIGEGQGSFLRYIFAPANHLSLIIPLVCALLFIIFCGMIDKKHPALTGIPMIVTILTDLLMTLINVLNMKISIQLTGVTRLLLSMVFIVVYMLAVSGVFGKGPAGKVLTVIFAVNLILYDALAFVYVTFKQAGQYGPLSLFSVFSFISSLFSFFSFLLTLIAMIKCVSYVHAKNAGTGRDSAQRDDPGVYSGTHDSPSGGIAALGFFVPTVGLILYLVWKDTLPLRARSAGKGALAGFITGIILSVLLTAVYFVLMIYLFH